MNWFYTSENMSQKENQCNRIYERLLYGMLKFFFSYGSLKCFYTFMVKDKNTVERIWHDFNSL